MGTVSSRGCWDWFLSAEERGNPATGIDRRRGDGHAWSEGNLVEALVHGASYYPRLLSALRALRGGDLVCLTDWRGDADRDLDGPGTEVGRVLADLADRGVQVRGLLWRSHLDQASFSEQENIHLGEVVNRAGGEILLDERVRGPGSQHQKLVLVRHPGREDEDVAFVGGIDLCRGRKDDRRHLGDPLAIPMDRRYGPRPPWHDAQLEVRGPAVGDLTFTFRERWEDPTPLDHRNPWRARVTRRTGQPRHPGPLPAQLPDPGPAGPHAVQVLRTYPAKRPPLPFAPQGERSIARAYAKAFRRARRLIYVEDQYLWSAQVARLLAEALRRVPELRLIAVVPRYPDRDDRLSGPPNRIGQQTRRHLRPGERGGPPDLRPRQGLRGRRRLGDGWLRQPQPALLDQRRRADRGGPGRTARSEVAHRPWRARRRRPGVRPRPAPGPLAGAPRPRRGRPRRPARPGERLRGMAAGRRRPGRVAPSRPQGHAPARPGRRAPPRPGEAVGGLVGLADLQDRGRPRRPPPPPAPHRPVLSRTGSGAGAGYFSASGCRCSERNATAFG
jgi:hypothetical protein